MPSTKDVVAVQGTVAQHKSKSPSTEGVDHWRRVDGALLGTAQ